MASTLYSSLELSRRLVQAGHEVIYLSHVDLREAVETDGYRFIQIEDCQNIRERFSAEVRARKSKWSPVRVLNRLKLGLAARKQSASSDEICSILGETKPDVLLIDFEMHYAILATRKLKIPTLLVGVWFSVFRSGSLPPMHTQLGPASDFHGQIKIKLAWWKLIFKRLCEPLLEFTPRRLKRRFFPISYGTNDRADLKTVAHFQKAPFWSLTSRTNWAKPHTYRTISMLSFNAIELELEHPQHPLLHYVGPMVHRDRLETTVSDEAFKEWSEFERLGRQKNRKLVYCSLGTFWSTDTKFLLKVVEAFRDQTDWSLVIGLGGKSTVECFPADADNVLVMQYAPQLEILKYCDAAITHGGITTINECITFDVPMLVCSTGYVDQPGCAVRVEHHGLGRLLDIKTATSALIEKQLDCLLRDDEVQSRIDAMQESFQSYENDNTAVKIIESLVRGGVCEG